MFLLLKKRDGYQRQPPRFIQLFPLRTTLIIVFLLCTRLEKIVHVCLHGVDHPHLLFEPCAFIVEPLLFFQKLLLLRLQCLQARQLFFSLHGKQCASRRLKDHKLRFVLCLEARLMCICSAVRQLKVITSFIFIAISGSHLKRPKKNSKRMTGLQ